MLCTVAHAYDHVQAAQPSATAAPAVPACGARWCARTAAPTAGNATASIAHASCAQLGPGSTAVAHARAYAQAAQPSAATGDATASITRSTSTWAGIDSAAVARAYAHAHATEPSAATAPTAPACGA